MTSVNLVEYTGSGGSGGYVGTQVTTHTVGSSIGGTEDVTITVSSNDPDEVAYEYYSGGEHFYVGRDAAPYNTDSQPNEEQTHDFTDSSGNPLILDSYEFDFRGLGDGNIGSAGELATEQMYIEVDRNGDGNYQRVDFTDPNNSYTINPSPYSYQYNATNPPASNPTPLSVDEANGMFTVDGTDYTDPSNRLEHEGTISIGGPVAGIRIGYIETDPPGHSGASEGFEVISTVTLGDAVVCFAAEVHIDTPLGPVRADTLKAGDWVQTENGPQKILWAGQSTGHASGGRAPVVIPAGAMGHGIPERELRLSRQHRVLIDNPHVRKTVGAKGALVPAVQLTKLPGIRLDDTLDQITYVHILLQDHEVVSAYGLPCETLFLGEVAQSSLSQEAKDEIFALDPALFKGSKTAYPVLRGSDWREVIAAKGRALPSSSERGQTRRAKTTKGFEKLEA